MFPTSMVLGGGAKGLGWATFRGKVAMFSTLGRILSTVISYPIFS